VSAREISELAEALLKERREEFITRAKASSVVQDELRRLWAKEALKWLHRLARNSQHSFSAKGSATQALPLNEYHAQNGDAK